MSQQVIHFGEHTNKMLRAHFGTDKPFVVSCVLPTEDDKGDRVYLSNGPTTITVPNVIGLRIGDKLYISEDNEVYEWHNHFPVPATPVSNNQQQAQAYGLVPHYPKDL